jgi:guanylate kinase
MPQANRLIILTGPSCAGKTPLEKSLRHLYPDINRNLKRLVAYNSRPKRPVEKDGQDYYFRSREQIKNLADQNKIVMIEARGDFHGFDLTQLKNILSDSDAFYEGNTFMAHKIQSMSHSHQFPVLSIFLSPFSRAEIERLAKQFTLAALKDYIYNYMLEKLIRRAENFKIPLTDNILDNLKHRARDAFSELEMAVSFDHVIVNHDGEDSPNWDDFDNLQGDALRAVHSLAAIITTGKDINSESWKNFHLL